ncbi:hypothetical protein T4D_16733 [Trichinella pseudospiralis]|uniref:Secreted protein n=1 Tax=Trichinella pseudospiralis TaxID=6337 RepID=A0A0V1FZ80_TRIPS|nr:hypothetical protein T4D_16733 [Trichinella pseudospiralis]
MQQQNNNKIFFLVYRFCTVTVLQALSLPLNPCILGPNFFEDSSGIAKSLQVYLTVPHLVCGPTLHRIPQKCIWRVCFDCSWISMRRGDPKSSIQYCRS